MLVSTSRHHDDHGRYLHARLRFLQCRDGQPAELDHDEPRRVADAVASLALRHVVITSVDRDDLADGGAAHFAATIRHIRAASPATTIEILTPDFLRKNNALDVVVDAKPDVFNHNRDCSNAFIRPSVPARVISNP